jgi:hypothetical protein
MDMQFFVAYYLVLLCQLTGSVLEDWPGCHRFSEAKGYPAGKFTIKFQKVHLTFTTICQR